MKNFSPRMILWLIFAFSTLWLWSSWQAQHQPVAPVAQTTPAGAANPTAPAQPEPTTQVTLPKGNSIILENDVLRLKINTQGGVVEYAELLQHRDDHDKSKNQVLLTTQNNHIYMSRSGLVNKELGVNNETMFTANAPDTVLKDGQSDVSLTLTAQNNGVSLNKTYSLKRGSYVIDVNHEVVNNTAAAVEPVVYLDLARDGAQPSSSMFAPAGYTGPVVYNEDKKFVKTSFEDIKAGKMKDKFSQTSDDGWVAMVQQYFVSAWVLPNNEQRARQFYTRKIDGSLEVYSVGETFALGSVAPAAKTQLQAQLFVGPQEQQLLSSVAKGLELSVDYGWAQMISEPIHWVMSMINKFIPNWGWTIVALTILIKLMLFPLNAASFKSMAKMKLLAPRLKQLQEQYGDDKMKLNQAMMALYKEEKVNPAGGCLPMLLQMPIFLAFYYVLQAAVEFRGAPWMGWIHDLSLPDPLYILPVLMMITMLVQTKLNPKPADPMQAKMMLFMPLIFGVTFFWFPAGLVLYWVVSNIFSIVQQWYMNKRFGINESLISLKSE